MSSPAASESRGPLVQALLLTILSLLLLPTLGFFLAEAGTRDTDAWLLGAINSNIDASTEIPAEHKPEMKAFYQANPPSTACHSTSEEMRDYREQLCGPGSDLWQFMIARRASLAALVFGVGALLAALLLGFIASRVPRRIYAVLRAGWIGLSAVCAIEVIVQGVLATWMSYWVTALAMHVYIPRLIFVVGALAFFGMWTALRGIFRRVRLDPSVAGERILEGQAPELWARLKRLAGRVGTEPPANLIAGIDDNFFVIEVPLKVNDAAVTGRSLYVSLPLLRLFSSAEADAVLAHELAHFRGGDTATSAKLGPALARFDMYLGQLEQSVFTMPAFFVLGTFRHLFELASKKESRERELVADRVAVEATAGEDLARALLKLTAYASHRSATERAYFEANEQLADIRALREQRAASLVEHVRTPHFQQVVVRSNVPHPFDSHPPLDERLRGMGSSLSGADCEQLVAVPPKDSWVDLLPAAAEIEDRMWTGYAAEFVKAHELVLAHRYRPEGDTERALVERHFPACTYTAKDGAQLRVTWEGLEVPGGASLAWHHIAELAVDQADFSHILIMKHTLACPVDSAATRVNLKAYGDARVQEALKDAVVRYWQRDHAARAFAATRPAEAVEADRSEAPPPA